MSSNMEITNQIAIDLFDELITVRTNQLNNTPVFLEQERQNLEMEIKNYKTHLERIQEVQE